MANPNPVRANLKGFQKGVSGNPSGTSKLQREVMAYAREHSKEAVDKLIEIMRGRSQKYALKACEVLLDRGLGRPPQTVTGANGEGPVKIEYIVKWKGPEATGPLLEARVIE